MKIEKREVFPSKFLYSKFIFKKFIYSIDHINNELKKELQ